jgi:hypothetical protein
MLILRIVNVYPICDLSASETPRSLSAMIIYEPQDLPKLESYVSLSALPATIRTSVKIVFRVS